MDIQKCIHYPACVITGISALSRRRSTYEGSGVDEVETVSHPEDG
jgi:hypothetical protein